MAGYFSMLSKQYLFTHIYDEHKFKTKQGSMNTGMTGMAYQKGLITTVQKEIMNINL